MGYVLSREIPIERASLLANGHVLVQYDARVPGHPSEKRGMAVTCSCGSHSHVVEIGTGETYAQMRDRAARLLKCLASA